MTALTGHRVHTIKISGKKEHRGERRNTEQWDRFEFTCPSFRNDCRSQALTVQALEAWDYGNCS